MSDSAGTGSFFLDRHLGPAEDDRAAMLEHLGFASLEALIDDAVPEGIRDRSVLGLEAVGSERALLSELRAIAKENRVLVPMIGLGFVDCELPAVLRRMILENPAWYTAYTPYQAEISQGRLEALLLFQTMVADLTALPVANASLLDESSAVVEAMLMCSRSAPDRRRFLVDVECLPQTVAVLACRAEPLGIELVVADPDGADLTGCCGAVVQYPGRTGVVRSLGPIVDAAHREGTKVVVACDPLALTLLRPPGEQGADIAVGTTQRFGMPLGFGGPHAAFLATTPELARSVPGRIVGVTRDATGQRALQLALQTREQHIRRERATSNICTAEVLPAVVAAMFAVHHGPEGLTAIARHSHSMACRLAAGLESGGIRLDGGPFFDTVRAHLPGRAGAVVAAAAEHGVNIWRVDDDSVSITCGQTTTEDHLERLFLAFGVPGAGTVGSAAFGRELARTTPFLTDPAFHRYRSEAAMTRYLRRLADLDLALDRTMIPLGSCTMKLNACIEMESISWPEFAMLHPFAPSEQTRGSRRIIADLETWLAEVTGYEAVSLQPNAGSQGELAGLFAIRAYHRSRGEGHRDRCLIPTSAHGTNPASAVLAGMTVVPVSCDDDGSVDLDDLKRLVAEHRDRLGALMITYPSTHGVYESSVQQICDVVHEAGGQIYLDGANLNALIGLARPGRLGADASHLNLHKTFCIPHGGGGPGIGPVAVKAHLAPFLPGDPFDRVPREHGVGPLSSAPFGSAGILTIPWAYIRLLGGEGLAEATRAAVLSANYLAARLERDFPVLYTGPTGRVAHECVLDLRAISKASGVKVDDVAKRLVDFGFHAPTMSFPVAGTLMVEPTESEPLEELERFVAAMHTIRSEIERVTVGEWPAEDNPLRNAPHTAEELVGQWDHPYSRAEAAFPLEALRSEHGGRKYFPPVKRVDVVFGDRNPTFTLTPREER